MIGSRFGHVFDRYLAGFAGRIHLSPNTLTIIGFFITVCASYVIIQNLFLGGVLILFGSIFDILDGMVARARQSSSRFGAFFDSFIDRFSDASIMIGLALHFHLKGNYRVALLSIICMIGAFMVSYARARAEGLGISCKHGIMERPERIILIIAGALSGVMESVLWVLMILTYYTVAERFFRTKKALSDSGIAE